MFTPPPGFEVTGFTTKGVPTIRKIRQPKDVSSLEITRLRKSFKEKFKGFFLPGEKKGIADEIRNFADVVISEKIQPKRFPIGFFTIIDDIIAGMGKLTPGIIGPGEIDVAADLNEIRREALEHNRLIDPAGRQPVETPIVPPEQQPTGFGDMSLEELKRKREELRGKQ